MMRNTIFNQENIIFNDYKADCKQFVKDGLCYSSVSSHEEIENLYVKKQPRIVFVCKEPNGNGGDDYRYWDWVTRKSNPQFGDSIAFWLDGIFRVTVKKYPQKCNLNKYRKIFAKYPFVLMNIKKIAGGPQCDWNSIYDFAKENAVLLQKQINLYAPNIIFCCGSTDKEKDQRNRMITIVKEYLFPIDDFVPLKREWHYCYYNREKHLLLIDSYHPSYIKEDTWKFDNLFKEYHDFLNIEGETWFNDNNE